MRLKDKVCIVTGAAANIGRATALKMAAEGARLVLCDWDAVSLLAVENELHALGFEATSYAIDVTQRYPVEAMIASVKEHYGHIDCFVANAGVARDNQLEKMTDEEFDLVINVNLRSVFLCARAVVKVMIPQKSGAILMTSSIAGIYGNFGQANYAASKAALIGMTKSWSKELGRHNIRVVAVCPGLIETSFVAHVPTRVLDGYRKTIALRRLGTSEEVANLFAFLASEEASYITGVAIEVGGGLAG